MMITPEHKQEIHNAIAKALQKIVAEKKEQLDLIDVVDIKKFGLAGYASQTSASQR